MQNAIMKTRLALLLLGVCATPAWALTITPMNSNSYYPLGGGSDISLSPANNTSQDITLGGDANSNLGYSCAFNPAISISNSLGNIGQGVQGMEQSVISSATGAVASMPMYLLSKSNKDLYNLLQNGITDGQDTFHTSLGNCNRALSKIKQGKSPYQDWFSISDSQGWLAHAKQAKQGQKVDVNNAKKQLEKDPEKYGVPWVHKGINSGGSNGNQVPIKVIYDVVIAGYNAIVSPSNALDAKNTQANPASGLGRYWKTANDAGNWGRLVLGDITISSKPGHDETTRGTGLMALVQTCPVLSSTTLTCAKTVQKNLAQLVKGGSLSAEALQKVSSNELMATPKLIQAMHNKDPETQALAISKWSQDVALQNVVDEALLLRRVLIAGSQTKPVHNLKPALTTVNQALNQLNNDIKNILFQFQVRKALMTQTAESILSNQSSSEANAVNEKTQTQAPILENGAVYKKTN